MDPPRTEPRLCVIKGCGRTTREKKPYCPDHISNLPYVKSLLEQIDYKALELEKVRGGHPVPVPSLYEDEILNHLLQNGRRSVKLLAKELYIEYAVLIKIIRSYNKRELVRLQYNKLFGYFVSIK